MKYRTKAGDMLDEICLAYYGSTEGLVEEVLKANRELAQFGEVLPRGVIIELPEVEIKETESSPTVRLWN